MILTLDDLYPDFKIRVLRIFEDVKRLTGREMRPTETVRPFQRQQELFEIGRVLKGDTWVIADTPPKIVTKAPPGMSLHAYGLAVDACFSGPDPYLGKLSKDKREATWRLYGTAIKGHGCRWGGDWNFNGIQDADDFDKPHCQLAYGLKITELLDLHTRGGIKAVWTAIDKVRGVPVASEWPLVKISSIV